MTRAVTRARKGGEAESPEDPIRSHATAHASGSTSACHRELVAPQNPAWHTGHVSGPFASRSTIAFVSIGVFIPRWYAWIP